MKLSAEHHLQGLRGIILCFPILLSILCFPILLSIFLSVCCVLSVLSCLVLSCLSRFIWIDTVLPSAFLVSYTPLNINLSFSSSFLFPPHSCLHLSSSIPLPHTSFSSPPFTTPFRSVVQLRNAIGITVDSKVLGPSDSRFHFFSFFISSGFTFLPSLHSLSRSFLPFPSPPLFALPLSSTPLFSPLRSYLLDLPQKWSAWALLTSSPATTAQSTPGNSTRGTRT